MLGTEGMPCEPTIDAPLVRAIWLSMRRWFVLCRVAMAQHVKDAARIKPYEWVLSHDTSGIAEVLICGVQPPIARDEKTSSTHTAN